MWLWNGATRKNRTNFEEHNRKSLDCLEQSVGRNMNIIDSASEDSGANEAHGKENIYHPREYLNHCEQTVGRNTNIKSIAGEGSEGNKEHVIGNWRKGNPWYGGRKHGRIVSCSYVESSHCK